MAVMRAIRASSCAFCAAVSAASAFAREWEVLQEEERESVGPEAAEPSLRGSLIFSENRRHAAPRTQGN